MLAKWYINYIRFVIKTSKIDYDVPEIASNSIIGFWHGDSLLMNLILEHYSTKKQKIRVVVTEDARGEYIEKMIQYFGGDTLRLGDGARIRKGIKSLYEVCKEDEILCLALDGPLGPAHVPKEISFKLAKKFKKPFYLVEVNCSKAIILWRRWDHYKIMLPFSKIRFTIRPYRKEETKEEE